MRIILNLNFLLSFSQILQLQMNDFRYHYMFTTFVSFHFIISSRLSDFFFIFISSSPSPFLYLSSLTLFLKLKIFIPHSIITWGEAWKRRRRRISFRTRKRKSFSRKLFLSIVFLFICVNFISPFRVYRILKRLIWRISNTIA